MRIRITIIPKPGEMAALPLNNHPAASVIYRAVSRSAPTYGEFLHKEGYAEQDSSKSFKFFVFSRFYLADDNARRSAKIRDGFLWFEPGPVRWHVCSPIPEFVESFIAGLGDEKIISIGERQVSTSFRVLGIELVMPPRFKDRMRFTTLSPVTVSANEQLPDGSRRKHYVRADDDRFGPAIRANMIEKYRALTGHDPADDRLEFEFDQTYIRRRGGVDGISKLIQYKETKIKCYQAPFFVRGSVELIQLGWECGFGNANSQGFGMAK